MKVMETEQKSNQNDQNREIAELSPAQENIKNEHPSFTQMSNDEEFYDSKNLTEEDSRSSLEESIQNSARISQKDYTDLLKEDVSFFSNLRFLGITITVAAIFAIIGVVSSERKPKPITEVSPNSFVNVQKKPNLPFKPSINTYPSLGQTSSPALTNGAVTGICAPNSLLSKKIEDWAYPTINTLSKNLIIAAGHNGLSDIHKPGELPLDIESDGTNGLNPGLSVFYEGHRRTLEGAVNLRTAVILRNLLQQVGFNVTYLKANPGEKLRSKMERIKKMIAGTDTFAFEIHYDDPVGSPQRSGSGVIPPNIDPTLTVNSTYADVATPIHLTKKGISGYDIALAQEFRAYPQDWRNGLGGPRRGVTLLELDKINKVEPFFRKAVKTGDYRKVDRILNEYASRVVKVFYNTFVSASRGQTSEAVPNCRREGYEFIR